MIIIWHYPSFSDDLDVFKPETRNRVVLLRSPVWQRIESIAQPIEIGLHKTVIVSKHIEMTSNKANVVY